VRSRFCRLSLFLSGFALVLGLCLCLNTTPGWGQATSTSTVTGVVTDQQNAAVPGAEVRLTDLSTNAALTASSNEAGRYVFVNVPPGDYSLTFTKQGFTTSRVASQHVEVSTTITVNASLEVGSTTVTMEVTGSIGAELQTTNSTVGTTISGTSIMNLPNLGRDVTTLILLQPAVTPAASSWGSSSGFIAGSFNDQNTYLLDGGNISDDMAGNTAGYQTNFTGLGGTQTGGVASGVVATPVESVEEVKVGVFGQTADFNNSTGGSVQMVTKRGTNTYHGSAYDYYFATNVGAANSWANNHTACNPKVQTCDLSNLNYTPLPSNHRERFGGSIGGQITPFNSRLGKWYGFFNYEGMRFPNVGTYEHPVPSATLREGVIMIPNSSGTYVPYNLTNSPVVVNGQTVNPSGLDPRGLGMNPIVSKIWNSQMPVGNDPNYGSGDGQNVIGYLSQIRAPLTTNNYIARIDHDFSEKWRWMASYRYTRLVSLTTNQVDIGGALPGDTLGTPAAVAPRPQIDSYFVTGLTTNITANTINDFRFAYIRQFWQWGTANAPAQVSGLGGALELGDPIISETSPEGTSCVNDLTPYNTNTQCIRQRFWDGQDKQVSDNVTMLKGDHLFQYGGTYQRNYDYHMRTDNGVGINNQIVYWTGNYGLNNWTNSPYLPSTVPSSQYPLFENLYSEVLGIVPQTQVAYTRAGSSLTLQPVGSVAFDQSVIPYYNVYFSDTWHVKPSFTLTYGIAWALEMPPYELNGKQVALVDDSDNPVTFNSYITRRETAALAGSNYDPTVGYALVRNVGSGLKYPYNPFYGQFSPRVSMAWNPARNSGLLGSLFGDRKTVIRAGYGRIYGRINGVNQVLVPLLGPGMLQSVTCQGANMQGQCLGTAQVTPANAFRIGTDGNVAPLPSASTTLPQPYYPGGTNPNAGDATALDPNYRPNRTDNVTVSVQRQLSGRMTMEVGYIGRISRHDFMEINLDAVPYMTTLGGENFAQAYAQLYMALCGAAYPCAATLPAAQAPVQAFLETALGGTNSAYCKGYTSCTAAFATAQLSNIRSAQVSSLWAALNNAAAAGGMAWAGSRTMISSPLNGGNNQATSAMLVSSAGWSNYNALYLSWKTNDYHGLTASSNFTWSRALGTAALAQYNSGGTALNPYDIGANYGSQLFDFRFAYNAALYYQPPILQRLSGLKRKLLGGWTIAPLFTAYSGAPIAAGYEPGATTEAFGESSSSGSTTSAENAVGYSQYTNTPSAKYGVAGSGGIGTNNPYGVNFFSNPAQVFGELRPCILGFDTSCGGYGNLRGLPQWNVDGALTKDFGIIKERVGASLVFQVTNVFNHVLMGSPSLSLTGPTTFGRITGQANTPRNMEFGFRLHF